MGALMSFLRQGWVVRLAQIGIGFVFVWAGLAKIGDVEAFADQIHNFRFWPVAGEHLLAMTLPWVELVAGGAMMLGVRARAGSIVNFVLMVIFTVAVAQAAARGLDIDCGCFGTSDAASVGFKKLAQNVGMTLAAFVAALKPE